MRQTAYPRSGGSPFVPILLSTTLILALLVWVPAAAEAQAGDRATGVSGQVLNGLTGQPVPGAAVEVEGSGAGEAAQARSDLTGVYRLDLPAGTYTSG